MAGSEKTANYVQDFKIELLVLKCKSSPKAIISGIFLALKVTCCGVLAGSVQSFLTTIVKLKFEKTLIEVSLPVFFSSP